MSKHYAEIAFTAPVADVQELHGSQRFYARRAAQARPEEGPDAITPEVRDFLADRDSFYLATVGETGWPYVQFRGGPPGFVHVLDEHRLGWADFRGNLQYISTGNLRADERVAMIVMDYPSQRRLKIFGHARAVDVDAELLATLTHADYDAVVERAVVVTVDAFDWNCPQHITARYTLAELEPRLSALRGRMAALESENAELRRRLSAGENRP
ncbi:pyridoxamine 5'-phosphate oxidase family protein [Pengzhenrongella sicca]|uniref:Pyridoxamine 5'-phosphate oxidase family protein n=1 Tax=Pengzhenrongella sicca TaxID=2819238 RepID=A0A8A4ZAT3_9MICO|nr:pyridoxamine 5'-phosphate oxidase family protein [Pengzhenrongella sicca]QTE28129.1 pyridoxamine 5'-phosphate oxidase family protein [Pengzhenrongella sicca]